MVTKSENTSCNSGRKEGEKQIHGVVSLEEKYNVYS